MRTVALLVAGLALSSFGSAARLAAQEAEAGQPATADAVVRELYELITFEAGTTPDWDAVRELFIEEAVIVLRTSRDANTVFSVETWIQDFVTFIEQSGVEETGFTEAITRTSATEFGDIANVWVLYEARIPGAQRPPQQGVDNFSLVRRDGRWLIAAITNEIPAIAGPLPDMLAD